jgi:single-strand DNA-binding protein
MNIVNLQGRLVKQPEIKVASNDTSYVMFTLAVYRDGEVTDFIDCVAWDKTAVLLVKHFKKGDKVLCSGALHQNIKDDKSFYKVTVYKLFF